MHIATFTHFVLNAFLFDWLSKLQENYEVL